MQPAEIIALSAENKVLISIAGADLIVADKVPYTEMVDPDDLVLVNMYNHTPGWINQMQYRVQIESNEQNWNAYERKYQAQLDEATSVDHYDTIDDDYAKVEQQTKNPTPDSDFEEAPPHSSVAAPQPTQHTTDEPHTHNTSAQPTQRSSRTTDDDLKAVPHANNKKTPKASFSKASSSSSAVIESF